jgi:hypothetical protein
MPEKILIHSVPPFYKGRLGGIFILKILPNPPLKKEGETSVFIILYFLSSITTNGVINKKHLTKRCF